MHTMCTEGANTCTHSFTHTALAPVYVCMSVCMHCLPRERHERSGDETSACLYIVIRTCGSSTILTDSIQGPKVYIYLIQRHAIVITAAKHATASRRDILIPAINPPTMSPVCCSPSTIDSEGVVYNNYWHIYIT